MSSNSCDQTDDKSTSSSPSPSPPNNHRTPYSHNHRTPYSHNPHHRHPYSLHPLHRHDIYPQPPPMIKTIYPHFFSPRYGPHMVGSQPYITDPHIIVRPHSSFYPRPPPPPPPLLSPPPPPPLLSPPPSTFYSQNTTTPSSSRISNDQEKINIFDMKSILTKKGDRYKCVFCDNTFLYRISLARHLEKCRKMRALDLVQLNEQQSTKNSLEMDDLKSRHQETFKLASLLINKQKEQLQEKDAEIRRLKKYVERQNINSSNGIVSLSTPPPPGCSTSSSTVNMQNLEHLSIEQKQAIQDIMKADERTMNTPQTANNTTQTKERIGRPAKVTKTKKRRGRPAKINKMPVRHKKQPEEQQQPHSGVSIMSGHDSEKPPRLIECTQCNIRFRPSPWNHGIFATICYRCRHT